MTRTIPDAAVDAAARAIHAEGWTCEAHEPMGLDECGQCATSTPRLARAALSAALPHLAVGLAGCSHRASRREGSRDRPEDRPMSADATAARALLDLAITHDSTVVWRPLTDTGGSPYVDVEGRHRDGRTFTACWHTRDTGTWRFRSAARDVTNNATYRPVTLTAVRTYITTPKEADRG